MKTWDEIVGEMDIDNQREVETARAKARLVVSLIEAREKRGWTQAELALRAGMKQSAIARFEGGTTAPSIETILKIMYALGLKMKVVGSEEAAASMVTP